MYIRDIQMYLLAPFLCETTANCTARALSSLLEATGEVADTLKRIAANNYMHNFITMHVTYLHCIQEIQGCDSPFHTIPNSMQALSN